MKKIALLSFLGFIFLTGTANASVSLVQSNTASSTFIQSPSGGHQGEIATYLGYGNGTTWQSYFMTISPNGASLGVGSRIYECNTQYSSISDIDTYCTKVFATSTNVLSSGYVNFSTSTPISFNTAKVYYLYLIYGSNPLLVFGASSSDAITNVNSIYSICSNPVGACGGFVPQFQFQTEGFDAGGLAPEFDFPNVPVITGGTVFSQWNILENKYPLNWVFSAYNLFAGLETSTAKVDIADISVDYAKQPSELFVKYLPTATSTNISAWKITFFSTSTWHTIATAKTCSTCNPWWPKVRELLSWIIWIEGMLYIIRQSTTLFNF